MLLALLLTVAALPPPLCGQEASTEVRPCDFEYRIDRWTLRDGLPQGEVTALARTPDGALWVATFGGIVRFDGVEFAPLSKANRDALGNNRITALCAASDGALWIGSETEGLRVLRDGRVERPPGSEAVVGTTGSIAEDAGGRLWVGTSSGAWRRGAFPFERVSEVGLGVNQIEPTPDGGVWIAANSGLYRGAPGGRVERVSGGRYHCVAPAADGGPWAHDASAKRLERRTPHGTLASSVAWTAPVSRVLERASGELWVGDDRLLVRRDRDWIEVALGLPRRGTLVRAFLEDDEDNLWIGGAQGLVRLRRAALVGYPGRLVSPARIVAPVPGTDGRRLLVGLYNGDVYEFSAGRWTPASSPSTAATLSVGRDGSVLAVSEGQGLVRVTAGGTETLAPIEDLADGGKWAVLEGASGVVWLSSDERVFRVPAGGGPPVLVAEGKGLGAIQCLFASASGDLWVGHRRGLGLVRGGEPVRTWRSQEDLGSADVRAFFEGPDGALWVGTYGGGLYRITADGDPRAVDTEHGLHEDVVSAIFADGSEHLVLLGDRAVSRVRYADLCELADRDRTRVHPQVFSSGPGIGVFEGNGGAMSAGWQDPDGALWLPTQEGLARFDPRVVEEPLPPPPAHVTSLSVDGEPWPVSEAVRIPPCERDLVFRFTAGTLVDAERARFRYRLDGYDKRWIDCGTRREAIYTHVPHGDYRFRVVATNRDGVSSVQPASLGVVLEPYFQETTWFRGLVALAVVLVVLALWVSRTRQVRRRARILEERVAARTRELEEARERLEERVEERTRQLREDMAKREALEGQLRESQRFEAIGRLAGGLAHDFNNYLTIVMADSHMALDELGRDALDRRTLRERIGQIEETSRHAADLTRKLLAYSRQQVLEPRVVDLNGAVEAMRDMLCRLVREEIELRFDLDGDLQPIVVDPQQLEQVILNLVANASDAIDGVGRITIRTERRALDASDAQLSEGLKPGPHSVLAVHDTGRGIDEHDHDHIFEPFYSTKPVGKGAGLGLASVAGIVRQSGGRIHVRSTGGRGTSFEVCFPVSDVAPAKVEAAPPPPSREVAGGRIALCDDQKEVGRAIAMMLAALGYEVSAFEDPKELLRAADETLGDVDLLVTDLVMPGMGGRELARRLGELRPDLRVLFLSGYASGDSGMTVGPEEGTRFLQKPFTADDLAEAVAELILAER